jgi:hypothetical protein
MSSTSISELDSGQILPHSFDDDTLALRVNLVAGSITINEAALSPDNGSPPSEGKIIAGVDENAVTHYIKTDTSGNLNVNVISEQAIVINDDPIINTSAKLIGAIDGDGNAAIVKSDKNGRLEVLIFDQQLSPDAATASLQTVGNNSLSNIDTKTANLVSGRVPVDGSAVVQPVSGPLTNAQLRASAVPVSGTFFQTTQPVSASTLPLPSGASTETTLSSLNTKTPSLGATTPALSRPTTAPRKLYISGFSTAPSTTYNNILDPVSGSSATDVRDYNTATVTILSSATTGSYVFEGAWDSGFTVGGNVILKIEEITVLTGASLINTAITPTNSTRVFRVNVSDVNYFRVRLSTGYASGIFVGNVNLTQQQVSPTQMVVVQGTAGNLNTTSTVSGSLSAITTVTTVSTVTSSNNASPTSIPDVVSSALTVTTTTGVITPTFGSSYRVNIPITTVSGTSPTLDIQIQESTDSGTSWYSVYDFPRITTTGSYNSPLIQFNGNRIRYVQTISGTTPSFTRAINRLQSSVNTTLYRQLIDRTIVLTTISSTTPSLLIDGCKSVMLTASIGTTTGTPSIQLQGSDDNGVSWYSIGSPLSVPTNSTTSLTVPNINSQLLRGIVSTAGMGTVLNYILIRGF